ncbi:MAG: hypothetical protein PHO15_07115 [Eubacteriales bacterium]|nr:hypothetical protein [Eubacteriales bacterium]
MIILLIIAFAAIGLVEVRSLIHKKYWRELICFCVFFAFSFVICILQASGVKLPSPTQGIRTFLQTIHLHF